MLTSLVLTTLLSLLDLPAIETGGSLVPREASTTTNTTTNTTTTAATTNQGDHDALVGYVKGPKGRGTVSIVVSCVLTLLLCVWSALHLNVPRPNTTTAQVFWLNVRWITTGIYAPELVVFTAWRQWRSARLLQKYIEGTMEDDTTSTATTNKPKHNRQFRWTLSHSFFACAGGFAFELESLDSAIQAPRDIEDRRLRRLTITARGMLVLAQHGRLPWVEREEIEDKSKANDLAKATALVQATWMLIQVIGRLAAKLPVTLLEVNTVAHVICAFAMYLFWWNKPLLPKEPIVLRDEDLAPLVAFMYSSSEMSGSMSGSMNPDHVQSSQTLVKTLLANLNLCSKVPELETICLRGPREQLFSQRDNPSRSPGLQLAYGFQGNFRRAPDSCTRHLRPLREKERATAFFERRPRVDNIIINNDHLHAASHILSSEQTSRWALLQQALRRHPDLIQERIFLSHINSTSICIHLRPEQLVATHIQNWPSHDLLRNVNGLVVGLTLWLANFTYGGFHAAAWNEHFPTTFEKWAWRASSSYIGFCGGVWVILNYAVARWDALSAFWENWVDGEKSWIENFGLGVVVFICGFSLVLARMYIVVEAFVSTRELPVEAYDTPPWTDLFPHF